jgi:cytochrome c553
MARSLPKPVAVSHESLPLALHLRCARLTKRRIVSIGLSTFMALTFAEVAQANDKGELNVLNHDAKAKLAYCEQCHGSAAQGFRGYYPIPRLAGQQTEYLRNQLQAFAERRRKSNVMFNVARVLSPEMISTLAASFHDLNPAPLADGRNELIATGKMIFEEGVPDANVPACSSCHGPDAKGSGPFPRLAGQLFDYISSKLTNWDKERGQDSTDSDSSAAMQPIARSLTEAQIKAVAAYLSHLQ